MPNLILLDGFHHDCQWTKYWPSSVKRCIAQNTKNAMDLDIVLLINIKFNKRWCSGSAYV
jgi:hypothetical protein